MPEFVSTPVDVIRDIRQATAEFYQGQADSLSEASANNGGLPDAASAEEIGRALYKARRVRVLVDTLLEVLRAEEITLQPPVGPRESTIISIISSDPRPRRRRAAPVDVEPPVRVEIADLGDLISYNEANLVQRSLDFTGGGQVWHPTLQQVKEQAFASWIRRLKVAGQSPDEIDGLTTQKMIEVFPRAAAKVHWSLLQSGVDLTATHPGLSDVRRNIRRHPICANLDPEAVISFILRGDLLLISLEQSIAGLPISHPELIEAHSLSQAVSKNIEIVEGKSNKIVLIQPDQQLQKEPGSKRPKLDDVDLLLFATVVLGLDASGCATLGFGRVDEGAVKIFTQVSREKQGLIKIIQENPDLALPLFPKLVSIAADPLFSSVEHTSPVAKKVIEVVGGQSEESIRKLLSKGVVLH